MTIRTLMLAAVAACFLPASGHAADGAACAAPPNFPSWTCRLLCDAKAEGATTCAEVDLVTLGLEPVLLEIASTTGCVQQVTATLTSSLESGSSRKRPLARITSRFPLARVGNNHLGYVSTALTGMTDCTNMTVKLYME